MSTRTILLAGSSAVALFLAYQTINAVGSHVPIDERLWVPPTVSAGLDDGASWMLAGHSGAKVTPQQAFELTGRGTASGSTVPVDETIDLSALAVFAATGDTAGLNAEVARIRTIQPDFVVPDDIADGARAGEERAFWGLVAGGEFAKARAAVSQRSARSAYRPSGSLMREIAVGEVAQNIRAAAEASEYGKVVALAEQEERVLTCSQLQAVWDVAYALAKTDASEKSEELYGFALANCADQGARSATLQKAADSLGPAAGARLTDMATDIDPDAALDGHRAILAAWLNTGARHHDGADELTSLKCGVDRLGAAIEVQHLQDDLTVEVERSARVLRALADEQAAYEQLGWYYVRTARALEAVGWFRRALADGGSDGAVEGLVMVLRRTGQRAEARDVALAESARSERIACIYVDLASEDLASGEMTDIGELARLTTELRSPNAAATLGWHHEKEGQMATARDWFDRSVEWGATESGVMGLAVTQHELGNARAVEQLAKSHRYAAVREFARDVKRGVPLPPSKPVPVVQSAPAITDVLLQDAIAAYDRAEYDVAIAMLERRRMQVCEARDVTMLRGWALHNAGRSEDAHTLFRALHKAEPTEATRSAIYHTRRTARVRRWL
ncbi:MAG: hypothetical protein AAF580_04140 [Pseudomonadota bacterium]